MTMTIEDIESLLCKQDYVPTFQVYSDSENGTIVGEVHGSYSGHTYGGEPKVKYGARKAYTEVFVLFDYLHEALAHIGIPYREAPHPNT